VSEETRCLGDSLPLPLEQDIDPVCLRFERAWQAGGRPAIEAYLAEVPGEARAALLRELLALELAYLRRAGERPILDNYRRRFPEHSELVERVLARAGESPAARYRPLRPHARGGLGEVQLAEDVELGREVALKRIQGRYVHDPEVRRRFLREAEITGRLEHPGIVPVYGLTYDGEGQPCYAMRFIEGQTLRDMIRRFHAADRPGRETAEQRLALRELLGRFLTVCNTIAYAHSRGVLHRDLKPANVMLGKYGETVVVDWGLAKRFRQEEPERPAGEAAPADPAEPPEADAGTRPGTVAGTPAYMSPEQAAGDWDRVGPASDIYSLGATLYELLVNRPPVVGTSRADVIRQIGRGDLLPPRQVRPAVPRALEAVCLKALARKPEDRYATATELAEDVARWLADEPVTAYAEPWHVKARRWMRRHRLAVSGVAAAAVVLAISLAVGGVLLGAANAKLRQQTLDLADQQAKTQAALQAEAKRRKETREALDAQTSTVMEDLLGRQLELTEEHRRFLGQALQAYERFAAETGQEEGSRVGVALAYWRVGMIRHRLGDQAGAEDAYREAIARYQQLVADFPETTVHRYHLAGIHSGRGGMKIDHREWGAARRDLDQAIALQKRLVGDEPTVPENRDALALSYAQLGDLLKAQREWRAAQAALAEAIDLQEQLLRDRPKVARNRANLASSQVTLGDLHLVKMDWAAARLPLEQSIVLSRQLVQEHPGTTEYRRTLAKGLNDLGIVLRMQGQRDEARRAYVEAIDLKEDLVRTFPVMPGFRVSLAATYVNLANVTRDAGQALESLDWYAKAIAILEPVVKGSKLVDARRYLRNSHSSRARTLRVLARHAEAVRDWARAIELNDEPHRAAEFRWERALSLAHAGEHAQAVAAAVELVQVKGAAADTLYNCARVCSVAAAVAKDDPGLQEQYGTRAVELLRRAVDAGYKDVENMQKDKDLDAIRGREDVKQLLQQLVKKPPS
jgi:serine/threonine-protein kinase